VSNHSNGLRHTSRIRTARLSTMTCSRAVHYRSMVTQCTAKVCGRVGLFRGRDVAITMNIA